MDEIKRRLKPRHRLSVDAEAEALRLLAELANEQGTMIDVGLDERRCGICEAADMTWSPENGDVAADHDPDSDCLVVRVREFLGRLQLPPGRYTTEGGDRDERLRTTD